MKNVERNWYDIHYKHLKAPQHIVVAVLWKNYFVPENFVKEPKMSISPCPQIQLSETNRRIKAFGLFERRAFVNSIICKMSFNKKSWFLMKHCLRLGDMCINKIIVFTARKNRRIIHEKPLHL